MTTPAVPIVDSIAGLRKRFGHHGIVFASKRLRDGTRGVFAAHGYRPSFRYDVPGTIHTIAPTAAEAAQALAAALTAAGYPAKEE